MLAARVLEIGFMNSKTQNRVRAGIAQLTLLMALALAAQLLDAQAPGRFVGTITAINGDTLTVKTDAGDVRQVEVPQTAVLKRVEPGQKDLSAAVTIQLSDLATGDRVLVRLDPDATGPIPRTAQMVTIKRADVALKEQQEREEWQLHGVGGLVKNVDAPSGIIVLTSGAGATAKTITVHVGKATVLKRYAPASVRFDLAQPAPIDAIQVGDQLRARGTKNASGTEVDAAEVVSGSFRNIAGIITSLDGAASTVVVKDLATKKQVTVHITPDAQMHALPETMARMLAARLKGTTPAAPAGASPAGAPQHSWARQGGGGQWSGQGHAQNGADMQQVLNRALAISFGDLKKGEAVMLVSTAGATDLTAITLLTGVEPLLQAPEASQNLLSNWSMGSGGAAETEAQ
jgi:hypothetical protein